MNLKEAMAFTRTLPRREFARFVAKETETLCDVEFTLNNEIPEIDVDVELSNMGDFLETGISIARACKEYGISAHTDLQLIEDSYCPGDEDDDEYREWQKILLLFPVQEPDYFTDKEIQAYRKQEEREYQANCKLYEIAMGKKPSEPGEVETWAFYQRMERLNFAFFQRMEELR